MKEIALLLTILCTGALNGMETSTISPYQMQDKNQVHRELLGNVKKLEGYDIYVGAGYSAAGEPMFFAMEKLDNQNAQIWANYADVLYGYVDAILHGLNYNCQNEERRQELKEKGDLYSINLMDMMCPYQQKFSKIFSKTGLRAGINGFKETLIMQKYAGDLVYVAYASTQPITSPFRPKKDLGRVPTLEEFEQAYSDIIISMGVTMDFGPSITEHRGIFKNPFYEIQSMYKNIAMKLHGWAGTVEEQIFNKIYMVVYPTPTMAELLHRSVEPGLCILVLILILTRIIMKS